MTGVEIRRQAREEHGEIRERLVRLEEIASQVAGGEREGDLGILERRIRALRMALRGHLRWEDQEAPPVLTEADAWGGERISWLLASHRDLCEVLDFCHDSCDEAIPPRLLAQRALDLVLLLRRALDSEERAAISSDVLRDDVATIDQVSG